MDLYKQQARQIEKIVDFSPIIQWVPGKEQVVPDAQNCRPDYGKYTSLIVEPNFLGNIAKCIFDHEDIEMAGLTEAAAQATSNLRIFERLGLDLLVSITNTGEQQLIIPNAMGLHEKLLEELHCTPLSSHSGIYNTIELIYWRVWWPQLRTIITQFVRNCNVCQRIKDRTNLAPG